MSDFIAGWDPVAELRAALHRRIKEIDHWAENPSRVWGLPTGIAKLDEVTGGLHNGHFTVIAARTSVGKTAFTMQIAHNVAQSLLEQKVATGEETGRVLVYTPEMQIDDLYDRLASVRSGVPFLPAKRGELSPEDREEFKHAMTGIDALLEHMVIVSRSLSTRGYGLEISDLRSDVSRHVQLSPGGVRLVIVDYIQKLSVRGSMSGYDRTTEVGAALTGLSGEFNIPVIALSQLSRVEPRRDGSLPEPTMHDIRESGRVAEDADNVWVLHRYTDAAQPGLDADYSPGYVRIEKQRGGPLATVPIVFRPSLTRFESGLDKDVRVDGGQ